MMHNTKIYAVSEAYDENRYQSALAKGRNWRELKVSMLSMAEANQQGDKRWYVLDVLSGREKAVEKRLAAKGVHVWLPLWRAGVFWQRGRKMVHPERPVMPGYVLACIVPSSAAFAGIVFQKGVEGFVGGNEEPYWIRDDEVNRFKEIVGDSEQGQYIKADRPSFEVGNQVRFEEGLFIGFVGQLQSVRSMVIARGMPKVQVEGKVKVVVKGKESVITTPLAFLAKL